MSKAEGVFHSVVMPALRVFQNGAPLKLSKYFKDRVKAARVAVGGGGGGGGGGGVGAAAAAGDGEGDGGDSGEAGSLGALGPKASASCANPNRIWSLGALHELQGLLESILEIFGPTIRLLLQYHPSINTTKAEDYFMSVGNLNDIEKFLIGGVLPALQMFWDRKHLEEHPDRSHESLFKWSFGTSMPYRRWISSMKWSKERQWVPMST